MRMLTLVFCTILTHLGTVITYAEVFFQMVSISLRYSYKQNWVRFLGANKSHYFFTVSLAPQSLTRLNLFLILQQYM